MLAIKYRYRDTSSVSCRWIGKRKCCPFADEREGGEEAGESLLAIGSDVFGWRDLGENLVRFYVVVVVFVVVVRCTVSGSAVRER